MCALKDYWVGCTKKKIPNLAKSTTTALIKNFIV